MFKFRGPKLKLIKNINEHLPSFTHKSFGSITLKPRDNNYNNNIINNINNENEYFNSDYSDYNNEFNYDNDKDYDNENENTYDNNFVELSSAFDESNNPILRNIHEEDFDETYTNNNESINNINNENENNFIYEDDYYKQVKKEETEEELYNDEELAEKEVVVEENLNINSEINTNILNNLYFDESIEKKYFQLKYLLTAKQFNNIIKRTINENKNQNYNFILNKIYVALELRLDNILFNLNLAKTIAEARQKINHGLFFVNKNKVKNPIKCNAGDFIRIPAIYNNSFTKEKIDYDKLKEHIDNNFGYFSLAEYENEGIILFIKKEPKFYNENNIDLIEKLKLALKSYL